MKFQATKGKRREIILARTKEDGKTGGNAGRGGGAATRRRQAGHTALHPRRHKRLLGRVQTVCIRVCVYPEGFLLLFIPRIRVATSACSGSMRKEEGAFLLFTVYNCYMLCESFANKSLSRKGRKRKSRSLNCVYLEPCTNSTSLKRRNSFTYYQCSIVLLEYHGSEIMQETMTDKKNRKTENPQNEEKAQLKPL